MCDKCEPKRRDPKYDVICEQALTCVRHKQDVQRGFGCGGATPHYWMGCDPCPAVPGVKCVPVCIICRERPSVTNGECEQCSADH